MKMVESCEASAGRLRVSDAQVQGRQGGGEWSGTHSHDHRNADRPLRNRLVVRLDCQGEPRTDFTTQTFRMEPKNTTTHFEGSHRPSSRASLLISSRKCTIQRNTKT
jgi:hypothetical protein